MLFPLLPEWFALRRDGQVASIRSVSRYSRRVFLAGAAGAIATFATGHTARALGTYPGTIVFEQLAASGGDPRDITVAVMNPDGSGMRTLAKGHSPLFSPDGSRIAYHVDDLGYISGGVGYPMTALRTISSNGGPARDICLFGGGANITLVRWSPGGRFIPINGTQNGPGSICMQDVSSSQFSAKDLTYQQGVVNLVYDWTPDGNYALWQAGYYDGHNPNLFYGDPDANGRDAIQLTDGRYRLQPDGYYQCARFSPDGRTIVIAGSKVFFISAPGQQSPLDGIVLDNFNAPYRVAWSPDGQAIAVSDRSFATPSPSLTISVVDMTSGRATVIARQAGLCDWSRQ